MKEKSPTNFLFKNLGSVHYPKGLTNPFGRSFVTLDFAKKNKNKIVGGFIMGFWDALGTAAGKAVKKVADTNKKSESSKN